MKRLFDIYFAFAALVIFFIPAVIIAVMIKLVSRHKVIFVQERIGKNKKSFKIYKFQTMVNQKITPLGKILRKTGLDEIPQFINVLKNDMSIVGPRALTQSDINRLQWNTPYYEKRWSVKPGITGYAQIYGGQHKRISWFFDRLYLNNRRISLDICIIAVTSLMNALGKTTVRRLLWPRKNLK
jgi:lipopolysaccharide/colanic/teichoic acid biosynthesis glycosyltransferase